MFGFSHVVADIPGLTIQLFPATTLHQLLPLSIASSNPTLPMTTTIIFMYSAIKNQFKQALVEERIHAHIMIKQLHRVNEASVR